MLIWGIFLTSCTDLKDDPVRRNVYGINQKDSGELLKYSHWYKIVQIDGHDYILACFYTNRGVGMVHSESCPCKKGDKNK